MYVLLSLSMITMVAVSFTNATSILPCTRAIVKYSVLSMASSSMMLNEMQSDLEEEVSSNMFEDVVMTKSLSANRSNRCNSALYNSGLHAG